MLLIFTWYICIARLNDADTIEANYGTAIFN